MVTSSLSSSFTKISTVQRFDSMSDHLQDSSIPLDRAGPAPAPAPALAPGEDLRLWRAAAAGDDMEMEGPDRKGE
ncbi:hypothetical protein GCM10011574_48660 [Microbispora bryophytorum]|uniref:Uncharacterized protein n=1 Tax=Microbispora bryophytorum TaxID=1460882 RepID=A0A8H9H2I0_9ACTN|nr:hypothetical protein GCM10011574_48660 [Microbispora bryophytorum]